MVNPEESGSHERPNEARDAVVKTVIIRTTPDRLFPFFTDPDKMLMWIGTAVELEPWPGGMFRVVPNRVDVIRGTYLEVTFPSRIVFTWGFDGEGQALPPGGSIVEVTLTPVDGGTEVRLVHRSLPDNLLDKHDTGWGHYVARIVAVAEGRDAGPDGFADPSHRHGEPVDRAVSGG